MFCLFCTRRCLRYTLLSTLSESTLKNWCTLGQSLTTDALPIDLWLSLSMFPKEFALLKLVNFGSFKFIFEFYFISKFVYVLEAVATWPICTTWLIHKQCADRLLFNLTISILVNGWDDCEFVPVPCDFLYLRTTHITQAIIYVIQSPAFIYLSPITICSIIFPPIDIPAALKWPTCCRPLGMGFRTGSIGSYPADTKTLQNQQQEVSTSANSHSPLYLNLRSLNIGHTRPRHLATGDPLKREDILREIIKNWFCHLRF